MNMTPRNLALFGGAILVGIVLGFIYPAFFIFLLIPLFGFVIFVLIRNKGSAEVDESTAAAARNFTAQDSKAAIYVMRKGFVAGQQGLNVTVNDGMTAQFRTGRFAKADVEPGEHTVVSQMASQTKGTARSHSVTVAAGECVLLDAKLNMGALQGSIEMIETRDGHEARGKLAGLKMVEWNAPE